MKKIIYRITFAVFVAASMVSCTSLEEEEEFDLEIPIGNDTHFNPPAWIQGKWGGQYDEITEYDYEFTTNNFLQKISTSVQDNNAFINFANIGGSRNMYVVEEINTSNRYKFSIKAIQGTSFEYDFQLQADSTMLDMASNVSGLVYEKRP